MTQKDSEQESKRGILGFKFANRKAKRNPEYSSNTIQGIQVDIQRLKKSFRVLESNSKSIEREFRDQTQKVTTRLESLHNSKIEEAEYVEGYNELQGKITSLSKYLHHFNEKFVAQIGQIDNSAEILRTELHSLDSKLTDIKHQIDADRKYNDELFAKMKSNMSQIAKKAEKSSNALDSFIKRSDDAIVRKKYTEDSGFQLINIVVGIITVVVVVILAAVMIFG